MLVKPKQANYISKRFIYTKSVGSYTTHPTPRLRTASLVRISNAKPTPNMIYYQPHTL